MLLKDNPKLTSPLSTWKHSLKFYTPLDFFSTVFFKRAHSTKAWADPLAEAEKGESEHIFVDAGKGTRECSRDRGCVTGIYRPSIECYLHGMLSRTDICILWRQGVISTSRVDGVGARTFVLMIRFRTSLGAAPVFCVIFYETKMVVCVGGRGDFSLAPPFHC